MTTPAQSARRRAGHAVRNDAAIMAAIGRLLVERGFDALSLAAVAKAADLSARPVAQRYADTTALAQGAWRGIGRPALEPILTRVWQIALSADPVSAKGELSSLLDRLARPDRDLVVMIELVAGCVHDSALRELVGGDLHDWLQAALTEAARSDARHRAVLLYLLTIVFGLPMGRLRPAAGSLQTGAIAAELAAACADLAEPTQLPDVRIVRAPDFGDIEADDEVSKSLLIAALQEIAAVGFRYATTARIAARAGCSEGVIFNRFDSKADLLAHAIERNRRRATQANWELGQQLGQQHSQAVADAVLWREALRPEMSARLSFDVELIRTSWHQPRMNAQLALAESEVEAGIFKGLRGAARAKAQTDFHFGFTMGYAISLLPLFFPDAWQQPFDAIIGGGAK